MAARVAAAIAVAAALVERGARAAGWRDAKRARHSKLVNLATASEPSRLRSRFDDDDGSDGDRAAAAACCLVMGRSANIACALSDYTRARALKKHAHCGRRMIAAAASRICQRASLARRRTLAAAFPVARRTASMFLCCSWRHAMRALFIGALLASALAAIAAAAANVDHQQLAAILGLDLAEIREFGRLDRPADPKKAACRSRRRLRLSIGSRRRQTSAAPLL